MKKRDWWVLVAAGAAGLAGAGIYQTYRQSWMSMRRAWRSFERAKAEPHGSPRRNGLFHEALRLFQETIDREPDSDLAEEALRMKGVTYGWLGQEDKALEALEDAVCRFPRAAGNETGVYLAQAYQRNGEAEKAYQQANRFLELSGDSLPPESWALRNALAIKIAAARDTGKLEEAAQAAHDLEQLSREQ